MGKGIGKKLKQYTKMTSKVCNNCPDYSNCSMCSLYIDFRDFVKDQKRIFKIWKKIKSI